MKIHYKPLSRFFPAGHSKAGQPTYFIEKVCLSLLQLEQISSSRIVEIAREIGSDLITDIHSLRALRTQPKVHTIRAGDTIQIGDSIQFFSWTGKPYRSKWLTVLPAIPIVKKWRFEMEPSVWLDECKFFLEGRGTHKLNVIAESDGLDFRPFLDWFCGSELRTTKRKPFSGNILCWDERVNY